MQSVAYAYTQARPAMRSESQFSLSISLFCFSLRARFAQGTQRSMATYFFSRLSL